MVSEALEPLRYLSEQVFNLEPEWLRVETISNIAIRPESRYDSRFAARISHTEGPIKTLPLADSPKPHASRRATLNNSTTIT